MKTIVRLLSLKISNLKNVKNGELKTSTNFDFMTKADIIGIYGQNGSGKTAMVESFNLLHTLLDNKELPKVKEFLIYFGEKKLTLEYEFLVTNNLGEYYLKYKVVCINGKERLLVNSEELFYKKNTERTAYKRFISINKKVGAFGNSTEYIKKEDKIAIKGAIEVFPEDKSYIFSDKLFKSYAKFLTKEQTALFNNLTKDFFNNFHVISGFQNGIVLANMIMPIDIIEEESTTNILYELDRSNLMKKDKYKYLEKTIIEINEVLCVLIPNLKIEINKIGSETLNDGEEGIRYELLSEKNKLKLPLRCESSGVLKLISILSSLIAVNNDPNTLVIIDELDSSIFEVLLGHIISAINQNGKGQLIFTSHNLRILEVLKSKQLFFTTTNEDKRFIKLKNVNATNNIRDMYIRALQLGGQSQELYDYKDESDIKRAFASVELLDD
ncbi:MAG: AAA family ATPase [Spirochaetaceae bacterium]|nr:AAA family ATPase [Spirochaetaceae bacterium]